jgi:hypothetical protein
MQRVYLIVFSLLFINVNGQERKNAVKLEPLSLTNNFLEIGLEHQINEFKTTEITIGIIGLYEPKVEGSHFNKAGHPANYHLTLSHTGTGHAESNDADVVKVLEKGGVVASVFQRGKKNKKPTAYEDVKTGKRYPVANGDDDDNTFDRHITLGKTEGAAGNGVVSGLQLKGVKNEDAGVFANKVDDDGVVRINK